MPTKKLIYFIAKTCALILLIALGIGLFFMREKKIPISIGHELSINAKKSTHRIVANEFLILIHPSHIEKLKDILTPLALELKMPILNWLLVKKKNSPHQEILPLASELASESRQTLSSLMQHPYVLDAQHNYVVDATALPDNWSLSHEWQLQDYSRAHPSAMNVTDAWKITHGSKDLTIGIVDHFTSGGHFTFKERFSACAHRVDFFAINMNTTDTFESHPLPHGEIMLQALGACNNVHPFSAGIDWQAQLLAIDRPSLGHAETFAMALLGSHINICEKSLIACPKGMTITMPERKPDILLLPFSSDAPDLLQFSSDMIAAIRKEQIIVVSSAGNDQANAQNFFPGGSPNVINVGALNERGVLASFSNWGLPVDILAPGEDIEFSYPNGPKQFSGTSIAAAYVAGAISLLKSVNKTLSQKQAKYLLTKSARPLNCEHYCENLANGENDHCRLLCCSDNKHACGKLALDINHAVHLAVEKTIMPPLLDLSLHYLLFLRDETEPKTIIVSNDGDTDTKVTVKPFDDNIEVIPHDFWLSKKGTPNATKTITISLRQEPFKRHTTKIELVAEGEKDIVDHAEIYLEYIPKK